MKLFWKTLITHLTAGEPLVLVTVTASSGSIPRGAGARMLMGRRGCLYGTIGGGAVEFRAQQLALELLDGGLSQEREFSLTQADIQSLGMVCGGTATVYFHPIPAGDAETLALAQDAAERDRKGVAFWLLSDMSRDGRMALYTRDDAPDWLQPYLQQKPCRVTGQGRDFYVEQVGAASRVYLFGGGHVAQELEPLLSRVGFRCTVLDDRPEFADPKRFPTAEAVLCVDFNKISEYITVTQEDYLCIMTRGHAYDTVLEAQLLQCRPRYNGMIGSRTKGAAVRKALAETYGYDEAAIASIVSPIGLPIGGVTPAEIAVSIAAQMIAVRAGKCL